MKKRMTAKQRWETQDRKWQRHMRLHALRWGLFCRAESTKYEKMAEGPAIQKVSDQLLEERMQDASRAPAFYAFDRAMYAHHDAMMANLSGAQRL